MKMFLFARKVYLNIHFNKKNNIKFKLYLYYYRNTRYLYFLKVRTFYEFILSYSKINLTACDLLEYN